MAVETWNERSPQFSLTIHRKRTKNRTEDVRPVCMTLHEKPYLYYQPDQSNRPLLYYRFFWLSVTTVRIGVYPRLKSTVSPTSSITSYGFGKVNNQSVESRTVVVVGFPSFYTVEGSTEVYVLPLWPSYHLSFFR